MTSDLEAAEKYAGLADGISCFPSIEYDERIKDAYLAACAHKNAEVEGLLKVVKAYAALEELSKLTKVQVTTDIATKALAEFEKGSNHAP